MTPSEKAHILRNSLPPEGLFFGKSWRISPDPLPLSKELYRKMVDLGPRLHSFNKACNFLYRQSVEVKQPRWIHQYLDAGKPDFLLKTARHPHFKNDVPAVIRPDLLVTDDHFAIAELDSVPGGIGVTAWLQNTYAKNSELGTRNSETPLMLEGFISALQSIIQHPASNIHRIAIVISEEARDYRPEMEWLTKQSVECGMWNAKLKACLPEELEYHSEGVFLKSERVDVIYRFFELFDLSNVTNAEKLIAAAENGLVKVTPPFKPQLEEKLWFALFWFPQLAEFWRRQLGDRYFRDLKEIIPFTWLLDPTPLPPHAVIPRLDIQDWRQLTGFSQKQRDLILKISGFSERAWGSRGVFLGSDMPLKEWKEYVLKALSEFKKHPYILQPFIKTCLVEHEWHDFEKEHTVAMKGRVRLCPYYFVKDDQAKLHGILATICPADKKLIHGMQDAIMTLAVAS